MRIRSLPRFHVLVFLIALIAVSALGLDKFADDPGVGWHLQTGNWILEHGTVPRVDPFLHATEARPWVSDQWLSDLICAGLYRIGGFAALYGIFVALYLLTYFAPLAAALRESGRSTIAATIAVMSAAKIAQIHLILRPVMFGIACFLLLFCALLPFYRSGTQTRSREQQARSFRSLQWQLPLLFLLWANLHPSFMLGLILIALVVIGLFLDLFFFAEGEERELRERRAQLLRLLAICFLATLLNPYGYALHLSILKLTSSTFFMSYHQEWNPAAMGSAEGQLFQCMLGAVVLSFFTRKSRVTMIDFVVIGFFVHSALTAVRFYPFFGIVVSPYVADSFSIFSRLKGYPGEGLLRGAWARIEDREARSYPALVFIAVMTVSYALYATASGVLPFYRGRLGPRPEVYPYQALERLIAEGEAVVAADPAFGGFITWKGEGRVRALIDDRNTLLGENFYREYEKYLAGAPGWRDYFRGLGARYLMLPVTSKFAQSLRAEGASPLYYNDRLVIILAL